MFLKLIYKRFGVKENRFVMMLIYGAVYAVLFFIVFSLSSLALHRFSLTDSALISLGVLVIMCVVYLIKLEVFKAYRKQ